MSSSSSIFPGPITTPEDQLQFEFAQHQQHLAHIQAAQAAEMAQLAAQATPNPVKAQANLDLQRQLLQQKLADKGNACMASPTDSIMSPCSKMLQKQKNKAFGKPKPRLLNKAFAQSAASQADKDKENQKSATGGLFGAVKTPIPKDEPIF